MLGALCMSFLVSCEQQEMSGNEEMSEKTLQVEAEIASTGNLCSRTTTASDGKVVFAEGDEIGLYAPHTGVSGAWTYNGGIWSTNSLYTWPDKLSTHDFCAYYPFTEPETRDAITMPDLSTQNGLLDQLKTYDFLVARCSTSYSAKNGVVSFTGEQSFKHVLALLSISLRANEETEGSVLRSISLKANNLLDTHTYHFGKSAEEDGMTLVKAVNELTLTGLDGTIDKSELKHAFVVNPLDASGSVEIVITYTRAEKTYTVSTQIPATNIQAGNLNKLNILIKKSGLVIEGNTVEDWIVHDLGDISVEENPEIKP